MSDDIEFMGWLAMRPEILRVYEQMGEEIARLTEARAALRAVYRAPDVSGEYRCVVCAASGDWHAMTRHCVANPGHHFGTTKTTRLTITPLFTTTEPA